jgi:GntR family transcriptional regulator
MAIIPLDRSNPLPLWAQLEGRLRARLDAGEFATRFPTDLELTEQYRVSRHTVREAVRHLNRTGVLRRERGRGTVVNTTEFEQPLGTLYSLFQSVESTGVEQTSSVIALDTTTDITASAQLGLDEDTQLVLLERLRLAGGSPLAIDRAWMPASFALPLLDIDFTHTALYAELDKIGAYAPNEGWERLTPVMPGPRDRKRLELRPGDAAFHLERLGKRDGANVEWRTTLIRGDRFRFVSDWTAGVSAQLRPDSGASSGEPK